MQNYMHCKTIGFAQEIYRPLCVSLCLCSFLTLTKCLTIPESHKKYRNMNYSTLVKPTWLFANNFMFYFFILSNFKPVIIGHTWQQVARRIPLNLIEYYIWYMLQYFIEICVQWQPHANYQRYAHWGLHYWFMITLQFRGSQNIAEVPLGIYEPLFQSMVIS